MNRKKEYVVLVNASGRKTGVEEKLSAHKEGSLHRAFSVFIFNHKNEMLIHKRASTKYHFAGLWTNACCGHPKPGEKILQAAKRRLKEELGISASPIIRDHITYFFKDEKSSLIEHEFDYLLSGNFDGEIFFDKNEMDEVKWISVPALKKWMKNSPEEFTPWFKLALKKNYLAISI